MTPHRQRMIHDLQLRGFAERTIEAYVGAVARLAQFFQTAPDRLGEEQLREYLLHLSTVRKIAPSSFVVTLCGIKFFYEQMPGRHWTVLDVAHPKREKKLPVVLSRDEVWQVLEAVRNPIYPWPCRCGAIRCQGVSDHDGARERSLEDRLQVAFHWRPAHVRPAHVRIARFRVWRHTLAGIVGLSWPP